MKIPRPMKPQWFHILLALSEQSLHGFGIQRAVLSNTDGTIKLWPAMLYRSLNTLEEAGFVRQVDPPPGEPDDERRQYYVLTGDGSSRLAEEAGMLARWAEAAQTRRTAG